LVARWTFYFVNTVTRKLSVSLCVFVRRFSVGSHIADVLMVWQAEHEICVMCQVVIIGTCMHCTLAWTG
jgi:hypothetical protein